MPDYQILWEIKKQLKMLEVNNIRPGWIIIGNVKYVHLKEETKDIAPIKDEKFNFIRQVFGINLVVDPRFPLRLDVVPAPEEDYGKYNEQNTRLEERSGDSMEGESTSGGETGSPQDTA
jgi:hypothetical protein